MPIQKEWLELTEEHIDTVPEVLGIYELGDSDGRIVYMGATDKSEELRGVLRFHQREHPGTVQKFRFMLAPFLHHPELLLHKHRQMFEVENGGPPLLQYSLSKGYLTPV